MATSTIEGRRIRLRGTVQGVGMRPWIYRLAREHGVLGQVGNESSGVTIDAFAAPDALDHFLAALNHDLPAAAAIDAIECDEIPAAPPSAFVIADSRHIEGRRVSIPPDLATCDECAAEIFDPANRRYRYPFTNCTNCGPRFTIATDVPYDRSATTMAPFGMCPACQREYDDPIDRRFHAQPNACKVCGPSLTALDADGRPIEAGDVVAFAAERVRAGRIVALKGLGGFHLACDATASEAVARLRARKHRDEKPFAVMVRDIAGADRIAYVSEAAREALRSIERPIVLLPAREDLAIESRGGIAPEVAPQNPLLGVMLPYTPLHHLLLEACGRPLVMTSANLADEPIVYRNDEAVRRLHDIADVILVHDREIVTRCDDSVVAVVAGSPMLLRRSRGYVPRAIALKTPLARPVLATGALLKNTFCLARGREAWLGPHIGDLENADAYAAFEEAIERMEHFLGFRGEAVAHDLHPDYLSTRYALARGGPSAVGVQHHHAHIASAIAEHGLDGPVIGVAFDGTGYGGSASTNAWGGEFMVATPTSFERVATFRPLALPGGDAAIRQPWRIAVAALVDAFGDDPPLDGLALFRHVSAGEVAVVRHMLASGLNTPFAHGAGRYFDAFGALVLDRPRSRYEGQIAFELNMAADPAETASYEFVLDHDRDPIELDLRPALRAAVADLLGGTGATVVSARFHNMLIAATASLVRYVVHDYGTLPVVLTGGCFQNARLAEGVVMTLGSRVDVHLHRCVPPGDGGIALGQACVAGHLTL